MTKDLAAEIAKLEETLEKKRAERLRELREKLKSARAVVSDYEAQIADIAGKPAPTGRRKRTSPAEMRSRIFEALSKNPKGLTQKEISDETGLNYGSVALFLKKHQKELKTTGERKQKRYFSK